MAIQQRSMPGDVLGDAAEVDRYSTGRKRIGEGVVTVTTVDDIGARAGIDFIVAIAARNRVIAFIGKNDVVARTAIDVLGSRSPDQQVIARRA
jgi:hypothetical protein